jgi:hypothetical protein
MKRFGSGKPDRKTGSLFSYQAGNINMTLTEGIVDFGNGTDKITTFRKAIVKTDGIENIIKVTGRGNKEN